MCRGRALGPQGGLSHTGLGSSSCSSEEWALALSVPAVRFHWDLQWDGRLRVWTQLLCLLPYTQTGFLCFLFLLKTYHHPSSAPTQNCSVIFDSSFLSLSPRQSPLRPGCASPLPPVRVPFSPFLLSSCQFQLLILPSSLQLQCLFIGFVTYTALLFLPCFGHYLMTALMASPPPSKPQCFPLDCRTRSRFFSLTFLTMQDPSYLSLRNIFLPLVDP